MPTHVNKPWGSENVVEITIIGSLQSRRAVSQKKKSSIPRRERKRNMPTTPVTLNIS